MRLSAAFLVVCILGGCAPAATQLVVVVDTDLAIPSSLDEVRLTVVGPSGVMITQSERLANRSLLPLTLSVIPSTDDLGPIEVLAEGRLAGAVTISRRARVTLVRGESRMLVLDLLASCVGEVCAGEMSCGPLGCRSIDVRDLPPWTGTPPGRDAGIDAPRLDAPVPDGGDAGVRDAGSPCTRDEDCDDGVACTTESCGAMGCVYFADDGPCADSNPCTDDVCAPGVGCTHPPNAAACNDDVFCNGFDSCGGGSCSVHGGNPCIGSTVCDEGGGTCTGCTVTADCPAATVGTFGPCDYADTCDQSATRTRTNRTYACMDGACVPSDTPDSEACSRTTSGMMCGSGSCGAYGPCDYSDVCDTAANQSRTCNDLSCSAGTCGTTPRMEMMACSRSTSGVTCGSTTCGAYGACDYTDVCDEAANQTRLCNDPVCGSGSCGSASRNESVPCSRSTTGLSCGSGMACAGGSCAVCTRTMSGAFGVMSSTYMKRVVGSGNMLTFTEQEMPMASGSITASGPVTFSGSYTATNCIWHVIGMGSSIRFLDSYGGNMGTINVSGALVTGAANPPCLDISPYGCIPICVSRVVGTAAGLEVQYLTGEVYTLPIACP